MFATFYRFVFTTVTTQCENGESHDGKVYKETKKLLTTNRRSFLIPAGIYLVCSKSTIKTKICSKSTIKTSERRQWRRSSVFIVNFELTSHLILVFLLLILNKQLPTGMLPLHSIFLLTKFEKPLPNLVIQVICSLSMLADSREVR